MNYGNGIGPSSSPELKQHTAALRKVHSRMGTIAKKKQNPHFRSKYADLATICEELTQIVTEEGFAMPTYHTGWYGPEMGWCCLGVLKHESGEWTSTLIPLMTAKSGMQDFGSSKTYAKRYALLDLTGAWVGEEDDDGNRAAGLGTQRQEPKPVEVRPAQTATKSMEIEAAATKELEAAKTVDDAQKVLDRVKLRVSQKVCDAKVLQRLQGRFDSKYAKEATTNG